MLSESNSCLLKREKRSESEIGTRKSLVVAAYLSSEKKKKGGLYNTCYEQLSDKWIVNRS